MRLAYPAPAEVLYALLRQDPLESVTRRFTGWRFSEREVEALLSLRPLALSHEFARFELLLLEAIRQSADAFPPVLRPRKPALDLEARQARYRALLKGKRVALVGPSQSVVGSRQGAKVESYDLIARVNFQWPVPPDLTVDIGSRMDLLYHCCNGDVPIARLFCGGFERTRFVCWQFGIESHALEQHCSQLDVPALEVSDVFEELLDQMRAFPTTGTVAVHHILSHDIEELHITGMTFFGDPYYAGYRTAGHRDSDAYREGRATSVGIHDVSAQLERFRATYEQDPRIRIDDRLSEILTAHVSRPRRSSTAGVPAAPPRIPAKLPGRLWGIATHYNPSQTPGRLSNLRRFADGVRAQGLELLVVELAFEDTPFEVPRHLCDRLERRRTSTVLWQKERLLNIGLEYLPETCDKVVWLDADLIFENDDWVSETSRLLGSYVVVQPFETACWLPKGVESAPQAFVGRGNSEGQWLPGMAAAMTNAADRWAALASYESHGHTGFAWAARRDLLVEHGFYDRQILGSGDFVMAHAMYGNEDAWAGYHWVSRRFSRPLVRHVGAWCRRFYREVRGSVSYVPGRVLHLWHGTQASRHYDDRLMVLKEHDFDPRTDLGMDAGDCWTWASDKPRLHEYVRHYLVARRDA